MKYGTKYPLTSPYDISELLEETFKNGNVVEGSVDVADETVRKLTEQITWLEDGLNYLRELKDDLALTSAYVRGRQNG